MLANRPPTPEISRTFKLGPLILYWLSIELTFQGTAGYAETLSHFNACQYVTRVNLYRQN